MTDCFPVSVCLGLTLWLTVTPAKGIVGCPDASLFSQSASQLALWAHPLWNHSSEITTRQTRPLSSGMKQKQHLTNDFQHPSAADQLSSCFKQTLKLLSNLGKLFPSTNCSYYREEYILKDSVTSVLTIDNEPWHLTASLFITAGVMFQWFSEKKKEKKNKQKKKPSTLRGTRWKKKLFVFDHLSYFDLICAYFSLQTWFVSVNNIPIILILGGLVVFLFSLENVRFYTFVLCVHL